MSKIDITRSHSLGRSEARTRVTQMESELKSKYSVKLIWNGDTATIKGPSLSGSANIDDGRLTLTLKVGLLLRPIAGKIKSSIEDELDKALA